MNTNELKQPTDHQSLLIYLAFFRRVLVRMPPTSESPEGRKFDCYFKRFADGAITFTKEEKGGEEIGPIPISKGPGKIEWLPTCFTRTVGTKTAHYYYTGDKPWLTEENKKVAEWDAFLAAAKTG